MSKQSQKKIRIVSFGLLTAGMLLTLAGLFLAVAGSEAFDAGPRPLGVVEGDLLEQVPFGGIGEEDLYISPDRRDYRGGMRLLVPAIRVDALVGSSTEPEGLRLMPGLYEFSQMPDEEGGNVSIAGHRDIYNMEFYHLDQLEEGDRLYVVYGTRTYEYAVVESRIVEPDDWRVILRKGYSSLTLTTCDPVGTTEKRLVITGRLQDVYTAGIPKT